MVRWFYTTEQVFCNKKKKPLDRICWGMGRVKYQITGSLDYCRKLQIFKVTLGKPLINGKHLLMGAD